MHFLIGFVVLVYAKQNAARATLYTLRLDDDFIASGRKAIRQRNNNNNSSSRAIRTLKKSLSTDDAILYTKCLADDDDVPECAMHFICCRDIYVYEEDSGMREEMAPADTGGALHSTGATGSVGHVAASETGGGRPAPFDIA